LKHLIIIGIVFLIVVGKVFISYSSPSLNHVDKTLVYFRGASAKFRKSTDALWTAIRGLDSSDLKTVLRAKSALGECRLRYKSISFFLSYFFPQTGILYNAPPKYEVEEPFVEYEEPHGLQQIEALLFCTDPFRRKLALTEQADIIRESAADLNSLLYQFRATDAQIIESIHLELIRIMTLYITGYDAPELKTGIRESYESLLGMQQVLGFYTEQGGAKAAKLNEALQRAILYLKQNPDFESFNRLVFLTVCALPLERRLGQFALKEGLVLCSVPALHYRSPDLFHGEVCYGERDPDKKLVRLGKRLFFERALSGNASRSCASCHQPERYYTDGLSRNLSLDGKSALKRNTPTLLYAADQSTQFWDGRAKDLDAQITHVLTSPEEMNASIPEITKRLNGDTVYRQLFRNLFPPNECDTISFGEISAAIAAFLHTLAPMNSDFDRYMRGDKKALTASQQRGFNLFMGKGQCATCHFAPFFNGLTPPFYNRSEYEVLGVPASDDFRSPLEDTDSGRFSYFPVSYYRFAFKTPTVRNTARTGPYMHHGGFRSLAKLMEFYNKGGGAGLGLDVPGQTLPQTPLQLTKAEINDIILFLDALTDKKPETD
jgi:cytochrome c peroxidase